MSAVKNGMLSICNSVLLFLSAPFLVTFAQTPSGDWILARLDENLSSTSRVLVSKMVIRGRREVRTIEAKSWIQGTEKSFTEYLAPPREKGTKMLKIGDRLWMYSPSTDRTIQIAGHMLRQSVMGSDLSYEDMLEDPKLSHLYRAEVTGSEVVDGRDCWVVALVATSEKVAYHSRKMWVDKERMVPLRAELFARGGKLLKRMELRDVRRLQGRWFPMRIWFKDVLKAGEGTEFIVESIEFDLHIPDYLFTKASLTK
ncbi:MAG: outer membrane lipoprotein-sorting protein [candidate division KSB1 bacterium]|nr:outer membrane lipoprotein-sorting protein [candidate division KSB1 bacterium]MDZ7392982.1 outer membrane lipoprotein-sorting protein [candidate division KSB1 bacterium]